MSDEESVCIGKEPCPKCGSRDNLARYSDGHGYCFGCGHHEHGDGDVPSPNRRPRMAQGLLEGGEIKALIKRGITEETCRKFGYRIADHHGERVQVAPYYDADRNLVGQKTRTADKEFEVLGSIKEATLFGQQLWQEGGRKVVVTEGEIDCMSVSQAQGNKWPTVSVPAGAKGAKKALAAQLEWLSSFEEVILMFDMDTPGQDAAIECAAMFLPGKCKLAHLPMKDPNELLVAGKADQIISAIWQAKGYRPDGIVTIADIKQQVLEPPTVTLPWFLPSLTDLTYGRRLGEIYAFGAGTGVGKTDLLTQQMQYDITVLKEPVGIFALEQQPVETAKRLAGKLSGKRFHIPDGSWTTAELADSLDTLEASGKVFFYDSFGSTDWDIIKTSIRFLYHSEGVRLFYVDHLTALAAAEDDERTGLEHIMAEIGALVKELDVIIHLISHLATPEGKPHEEGGRVMIRHFKGSRAIGFWCPFMFGLERDTQHEDAAIAGCTTFRILKDRFTGRGNGKLIYLGFNDADGSLYETSAPTPSTGFTDQTGKGGNPDF